MFVSEFFTHRIKYKRVYLSEYFTHCSKGKEDVHVGNLYTMNAWLIQLWIPPYSRIVERDFRA